MQDKNIIEFAGITDEELLKPFPGSFKIKSIEESLHKSATFRAAMKVHGHSVAASYIERVLTEHLTEFYNQNPEIRKKIEKLTQK